MSHLTYRAEQALLGSVLVDQKTLDLLTFVRPEDFGEETHQIIYRSVHEVIQQHPDAQGAQLAELVAETSPKVEIDYLHSLALSVPDPDVAAVYGRMVVEAATRRETATAAVRYAEKAEEVGSEHPDHPRLTQLATSFRAQADAFADVAERAGEETSPSPPRTQERAVLADLLQHPHIVPGVIDWLPAEAFAAGPNRDIYQAITTVSGYGEPVNDLTVAYQLGRIHSRHLADSESAPWPAATPHDLAHLGRIAITAGLAIQTGRELLTRYAEQQLTNAAEVPVSGATTHPAPSDGPLYALGPRVTQPPPTTENPDQPRPRP